MKKRALSFGLALIMMIGLGAPAFAAGPTFSDVPANHWAYANVEAVAKEGLMKGTGGGLFSPDMKVSVAQFLTLVGRIVFPETKVSKTDSWYGPYVTACRNSEFLTGTRVDTNNVEAEITRYDMAVILRAAAKKLGMAEKSAQSSKVKDYLDIPTRYADAVLAVYGMGLIKGDQAGNFNGDNTMMRSEMATVMVRLMELSKELAQNEEQTSVTQTPISGGTTTSSGEGTGYSEPDFEGARKAIIQGLTNAEEEINTVPYHILAVDMSALVDEILDAELGKYFVSSTFQNSDNGVSKSVIFYYFGGANEACIRHQREMKEAAAKVEEIMASTVKADMSDYEIAKALHDYLVFNVEYNYRWASGNYSDSDSGLKPIEYYLYDTLIKRDVVCEQYAYTYKYLMNLAGVPCEQISGYAGEAHAWNIVQIDGEWYHVDVTWDDLGGDGIRYDYFLKSDQAMKRDHYTWEAPHVCTSTKYDDVTDDLNDEEQAEQEAKRKAAIMADFMERFNTLPFRSEEGLTGTDELSDEELLSYKEDVKIYYPMDEYTYKEMEDIYFVVVNIVDDQVFQLNDQFESSSYEGDQWYLVVWRWDIWREYERRHEAD